MSKPILTSRPRTAARVGAVQALFQSEQSGDSPETVIDQFIRHRLGEGPFEEGRVPDAHVELFARIVRTAGQRLGEIDKEIAACLPEEWPFGRLDPVLRAVLRAGGAELAMRDGPPVAVVINEYVDVAHGFFQGDEPRMVNGILETLSRAFRKPKAAAGQSDVAPGH